MTDDLTPEEAEALRGLERKRRRRWALGVGAAIAALLLAAYLYDCYWTAKFEAKSKKLWATGQLVTLEETVNRWKTIPEDQNAALVFVKAFAARKETPQGDLALQLKDPLGARPSEETLSLLRQAVDENAEALRLIHAGAALPQSCYPLQPADSFNTRLLPPLESLRKSALLCSQAAVVDIARGDGARAAQDIGGALALAASMADHARMISELVRVAAGAIAIRGLEQALALGSMTADGLDAVSAALALEERGISLRWPLIMERSAAEFVFANEVPKWRQISAKESGLPPLYLWLPGVRQRDALYYLEVMDRYSTAADLPLREQVRVLRTGSLGLDYKRLDRPAYTLSDMLLSIGHKKMERTISGATTAAVARTALAVEKWRMANGRWPDSLEQLVGQGLDAVPQDPYGYGPLTYRKTDTGVIVYSIGPDNADEGGLSLTEAQAKYGSGTETYDTPFHLLNPELRGARTMTFREEVVGSGVQMKDLQAAGLDEAALKRLGLTEEDLKALR